MPNTENLASAKFTGFESAISDFVNGRKSLFSGFLTTLQAYLGDARGVPVGYCQLVRNRSSVNSSGAAVSAITHSLYITCSRDVVYLVYIRLWLAVGVM